jgi:hypothetical protein
LGIRVWNCHFTLSKRSEDTLSKKGENIPEKHVCKFYFIFIQSSLQEIDSWRKPSMHSFCNQKRSEVICSLDFKKLSVQLDMSLWGFQK